MGRRRRRVVKIVRKKLPTVFTCPSCGQEAIRVSAVGASGSATVQCGTCGLKETVDAWESKLPIDIYCKFVDIYNSRRSQSSEVQEVTAQQEEEKAPVQAPAGQQAELPAQGGVAQ